jgi:hypothetical protein
VSAATREDEPLAAREIESYGHVSISGVAGDGLGHERRPTCVDLERE